MVKDHLYLRVFLDVPALLNISGVTRSAELHTGDVHDDIAECHADHVVVVDGPDVDAVQVGQRHQQILPGHWAPIRVLPLILETN